MSFNRTIKYFKSIRAYVYCDICKEVVGMDINKENIRRGLESSGVFLYKFRHINRDPDPENPEDESLQQHTCAVYIDENYEVKQIKCYFGDDMLVKAEEGDRIPILIKKVPEASVRIGMISMEQYKVIQLCDGTNTMEEIVVISGKSSEDLKVIMEQLREKGIINIIIRA
ncbi:MAG: hypothetical protein ACTSWY_05695 [Promethearchaeota archaeon]